MGVIIYRSAETALHYGKFPNESFTRLRLIDVLNRLTRVAVVTHIKLAKLTLHSVADITQMI